MYIIIIVVVVVVVVVVYFLSITVLSTIELVNS
jgi:hypothetical protein